MTMRSMKLQDDGSITLPSEVLKDLGVQDGDTLFLIPTDTGMLLSVTEPGKDAIQT